MREPHRKQQLLPENVKMLWQASPATSDGGGGGNSDDGTHLTGTSERTFDPDQFHDPEKMRMVSIKTGWARTGQENSCRTQDRCS
jgi:hypothetical protein